MPRNSSGVYTLPVAAFTPGEVITSADANSNNGDIGTALTQSLATTGVSSMTGQIKASEGAAGAPSYTWASDLDTGFYHVGAGIFAFVNNGGVTATFNADHSVSFAGSISVAGSVNFVGAITFGGAVIFSSTVSFTLPLGETVFGNTGNPNLVLTRTENDASDTTHILFCRGSAAGTCMEMNTIGDTANGVASLQWATSTGTDLLDLSIGGVLTIPQGILERKAIATPAAPAAGLVRTFNRTTGSLGPTTINPAGQVNSYNGCFVGNVALAAPTTISVDSDALSIDLELAAVATSAGNLQLRIRVAGVVQSGGNYFASGIQVNGGTATGLNSSSATAWIISGGGITLSGGTARITVVNSQGSAQPGFISALGAFISSPFSVQESGFNNVGLAAIDGVQFLTSSGTLTGTAYVHKRTA